MNTKDPVIQSPVASPVIKPRFITKTRLFNRIVTALVGLGCFLSFVSAHAVTIFVTGLNQNIVESVTAGGTPVIFANTGVNSHPWGVAFDSAGNLYVSRNSTIAGPPSIERFTPDGIGTPFGDFIGSPSALAFDSAGNLFVAGVFGIYKITLGGVTSLFVTTGAVFSIAFDSAGNLYASGGSQIIKFTPNGVGTVFFDDNSIFNIFGLAIDSADNVYAAIPGSQTIKRVTPGGVSSVFADSVAAFGLTFDGANNLYASTSNVNNNDATIAMFTPDGVGSLFADLGNIDAGFIAIQQGGCPPGMCCVCHKGLTLSLICGSLEYRRHVDHGDTLGTCQNTTGKR